MSNEQLPSSNFHLELPTACPPPAWAPALIRGHSGLNAESTIEALRPYDAMKEAAAGSARWPLSDISLQGHAGGFVMIEGPDDEFEVEILESEVIVVQIEEGDIYHFPIELDGSVSLNGSYLEPNREDEQWTRIHVLEAYKAAKTALIIRNDPASPEQS